MSDLASARPDSAAPQQGASDNMRQHLVSAAFGDLPHRPSSSLSKEGWRGVMREVDNHGGMVVTHGDEPEAVVLSVSNYTALARMAQREQAREAQQLADLRAHFDQRLASLSGSQAHQALNAFLAQ